MHTTPKDLDVLSSIPTFLLALLLHVAFLRTPAEAFPAQLQVLGSLQPITAAPGDDVILPCHLEPQLDVQALTVEWSKPDLKPDPSDPLSRVEYVHLYRNKIEVTDMKLASYFMRTELFRDELRHGNISLKIHNVTLADSGRYRCFIPKLKSRVKFSIVELVVDPQHVRKWPTEPSPISTQPPTQDTDEALDLTALPSRTYVIPFVVLGIMLILCVGFGIYSSKHRHHEEKSFSKMPEKH